jgi:hypothetical protein
LATWEDVSQLALSLPETEEGATYGGNRAWTVRNKMFVWERPLRKSDLAALGDAAPDGPILGAKVEHLVAKEALLAVTRASSRHRISRAIQPSSSGCRRSASTCSKKWWPRPGSPVPPSGWRARTWTV